MSDDEKPKTAAEWKEYFLAKGYGGAPVIKAPKRIQGTRAQFPQAKKYVLWGVKKKAKTVGKPR